VTSAISCFNCDGSGITVLYPNVESIVKAGEEHFLLGPKLDFYEAICPYCQEPPPPLYPSMWLIWPKR
jgi:hypothetical protein